MTHRKLSTDIVAVSTARYSRAVHIEPRRSSIIRGQLSFSEKVTPTIARASMVKSFIWV